MRTRLMVAWQHEGAPTPVLMHTGEYHDDAVRLRDGWRLRRRCIVSTIAEWRLRRASASMARERVGSSTG